MISEEQWDDVCQEFAHSVVFIIIVILAIIGWSAFCFTAWKA